MAFTALDIIKTATKTLFDADHVRWPLLELLDYINEACRAIATAKPNASTDTVTINLVQGTLQKLPDSYTILSRVTRNMVIGHTDPGGPVGGDAIRMVSGRALMDAYFPGWQSNTALFGPVVKHVIYDDADLRHFYVIPGNDGTGKIEAVVGVMPAAIVLGGDPTLEANYAVAIALPDLYRTPVLDYTLYRAFAKDQGIEASAQRAQMHLGSFQAALGIVASAQTTMSAARVPQAGA